MRNLRTFDVKEALESIKILADRLLKAQTQKIPKGEKNFKFWFKELKGNVEYIEDFTGYEEDKGKKGSCEL